MELVEVHPDTSQEKEELLNYLLPHETHALFLLGNLLAPCQPSTLYIAKKGGSILGVCGYYPTYHSCSLFSEKESASIAFAHLIHERYSSATVLGMKQMVLPTYETLLSLGHVPLASPEQTFFELSLSHFIPHATSDGIIREIGEGEIDEAVLLFRTLHQEPHGPLLTEVERKRVRALPLRFCLEVNGQIVTMVSSNGLVRHAFQLLGVVTDPPFRGKGYAKAVCSHLIQVMKKKGAKTAVLFTGCDNLSAIRCYQALGFRETNRYYVARFRSGM